MIAMSKTKRTEPVTDAEVETFVRLTYPDLYDDVDNEFLDVFVELVGRGKNPNVLAASIEYCASLIDPDRKWKTQQEVADEYDVSRTGVRFRYPEVWEMAVGELPERAENANLGVSGRE
jgi:hypothetical protein